MKKIYITGIAGMLGSNMAYCLKDDYKIYGCDKIAVHMPGIATSTCDVLEEAQIKEELKRIAPQALVHTVAVVNVDLCEKDPVLARRMNTESTEILQRICQELHIKMIYISTDAVFAPDDNTLSSEEDPKNPLNEYARTKLEGEVKALVNPGNLVLRTNIYGYNIQDKKSFGEWVLSALQKGQTLTMFEDIYFSPILVNDLAMLISECVKENLCGLYHACGTGAVSKYEFGRTLQEEFDLTVGRIVKSDSSQFPFVAQRSKHMGMSNNKLSERLNLTIRTPLESIKAFRELYTQGYPKKLKEFGGIQDEN